MNLCPHNIHTDPIPGVDFDLWFPSKKDNDENPILNASY